MACAAGALSFAVWIPALAFIPHAIVTRMAFAAEPAGPGSPELGAPVLRPDKARCPVCSVRKPAHRDGKTKGVVEQCADQAGSVTAAKHANSRAQDANLAVLLDWHLNASSGYGFGVDGASCSAQTARAAPIPIAASAAYDIIARFRDDSAAGSVATSRRIRDETNANLPFPKVAE
jgi:hypothetical protein